MEETQKLIDIQEYLEFVNKSASNKAFFIFGH